MILDRNKELADCDLLVRDFNVLAREGLKTVGDFLDKQEEVRALASERLVERVLSRLAEAEKEASIVMIEVEKLSEHPQNPRKAVGDVTELADSIKHNGIMQNLTVVPWFSEITGKPADDGKMDGYYRVLIGHRRLAAAKKAGLKKVPCAVLDGLDLKEQVGIMLAENMQRSDLTVVEQADGIQMMLDLGDTVSIISQKTGLSETTIRRRRSLNDYDREEVMKSMERGGTLADYEKLNSIKDKKDRENLIKHIGTNNFGWNYENIIERQKKDEHRAELEKWLSEWAERIDRADELTSQLVYTYYNGVVDFEKPNGYDPDKKYWYTVNTYGFTVYTRREPKKETPEEIEAKAERERAEAERRGKMQELRSISDHMKNRREEFVRNFSGWKLSAADEERRIGAVMKLLSERVCNGSGYFNFRDKYQEIFGQFPAVDGDGWDVLGEDIDKKTTAERILAFSYIMLSGDMGWPYQYDGTYKPLREFARAYELLEIFGYELSDEERAMIDGTHDAYIRSKE